MNFISSLFQSGYFINIIFLVSQLKHSTTKSTYSLGISKMWFTICSPSSRSQFWKALQIFNFFIDALYFIINYQKSKTIFKSSINSHVYRDTHGSIRYQLKMNDYDLNKLSPGPFLRNGHIKFICVPKLCFVIVHPCSWLTK